MTEKMKKIYEDHFTGEITVAKTTLWLAGAVCLLAGVVYGLCMAPMTHGLSYTIGCNNGNNNVCSENQLDRKAGKKGKEAAGAKMQDGKTQKEK